MTISKEFKFDSAHKLYGYSGKCENIHGHTYKLIVHVNREVDSNGFVVDYSDLKELVEREIIDKLDHKVLNSMFYLNPTAEYMCLVIFNVLMTNTPLFVSKIELSETTGSNAVLTREEFDKFIAQFSSRYDKIISFRDSSGECFEYD